MRGRDRSELPGTTRRSSTDAKRLAALWRISTGTAPQSEPLTMMLAEGAAVIRPGQTFAALLCRRDGDELIVDAAVSPFASVPAPLLEDVLAAGRTFTWDDLIDDPLAAALPAVRRSGWRALIVTPFAVGSTQYALAFTSPQPVSCSFAADDEAFVEILAGYIERGLQQQWQAERLRFQMQHDALTGLINRAQFRARVRSALAETGSCGLIVADVVALRELNDRLGHQTSDALLVEVGAALCERNWDGEFTGRLFGGSFGICLPRIETRGALDRRIAEYAQAFGTPFSTGDREGTEQVELSAVFGSALAPDEAHGVDELIARAESAATALVG
jgi:diguanylate cyclase (GGDEF)-like protein